MAGMSAEMMAALQAQQPNLLRAPTQPPAIATAPRAAPTRPAPNTAPQGGFAATVLPAYADQYAGTVGTLREGADKAAQAWARGAGGEAAGTALAYAPRVAGQAIIDTAAPVVEPVVGSIAGLLRGLGEGLGVSSKAAPAAKAATAKAPAAKAAAATPKAAAAKAAAPAARDPVSDAFTNLPLPVFQALIGSLPMPSTKPRSGMDNTMDTLAGIYQQDFMRTINDPNATDEMRAQAAATYQSKLEDVLAKSSGFERYLANVAQATGD